MGLNTVSTLFGHDHGPNCLALVLQCPALCNGGTIVLTIWGSHEIIVTIQGRPLYPCLAVKGVSY